MSRTWNTSWPSPLKIFGCSVVWQTHWRMVVFPALAQPMIRTRKHGVFLWRFCAHLCCLSISSAPWISVLERDIFHWDAWDGGSAEEAQQWAVYCLVMLGQPHEWCHWLSLPGRGLPSKSFIDHVDYDSRWKPRRLEKWLWHEPYSSAAPGPVFMVVGV